MRGRSDSSESIQIRPSQGPHVSVLLHHCHQLLNELFLSAAGRPEACSPEQFNAPGSDPLLLGVPVVLLTLQIAGVLTREDVAVAKSMSAMYLAISGVTDLRDITITRKAPQATVDGEVRRGYYTQP